MTFCFAGIFPRPFAADFDEVNAVHGAGRSAEAAARAASFQNGVQVFRRAADGIGWTGTDAPGAADAFFGTNLRAGKRHLRAVFRVESDDGQARCFGELRYTACAARGAAVDGSQSVGNGLRIGGTAVEAALTAFSLRQQIVNGLCRGSQRRKRHGFEERITKNFQRQAGRVCQSAGIRARGA